MLHEVSKLVGLSAVKEEIAGIVAVTLVNGKTPEIYPNALLVGPPGTGKTFVAKIVGELLLALDIQSGEFKEMSSADLKGQFVGQTVPKTQKFLEENLNNVLFFDEANAFDKALTCTFMCDFID